jgi:SAM-dependent methyltransferase
MDGRPIAWDKHAYWMPNQFVEVNPIEYIEKRRNAIISGLKFQKRYIENLKRVNSFRELQAGDGTHIIWNRSSDKLDIPDESIDAIITDPPYGHNVQYGELSHYWLVWLREELSLGDFLFSLENEILVHRKKQRPNHKDYDSYFAGLQKVFAECFRVLKPNGILAFTFNNKDMKAWYAVIKAVIKSGFCLDPRGIVFQGAIENYKNTSHTRYAGSIHGDFIYTFHKTKRTARLNSVSPIGWDRLMIQGEIQKIAERYLLEKGSATTSDLYTIIMANLIPIMAKNAESDKEFAQLNSVLGFDKLEQVLRRYFKQEEETKLWIIKPPECKRE